MRRTGTMGTALAYLVSGCSGFFTSIDWNAETYPTAPATTPK